MPTVKASSLESKIFRGGSRTAATSKMELFVIIVNLWSHDLKWYLSRWNVKVLKLLLCTFIFFLNANLLSKTWVCSCMKVQYFGWKLAHQVHHLHILPKLERSFLKVHVLLRKAGIYSWNLSEKVLLMYEHSFSIPFLCNLKYINLKYNSMKSSCKQQS